MNAEAEVALALSCAPGVGRVSVNLVLGWARSAGYRLSDLNSMSQRELVGRLPAGLELAGAALGRCRAGGLDRAKMLIARVQRAGGQVLLSWDEDYPEGLRAGLGKNAPPLLFVLGDVSRLGAACAGIVGTRRPSRAGARLAQACARAFVSGDVSVVSGGAAGIDLAAHNETLESGGRTIVILPQGLLSYRGPRTIAAGIESGAATLVSESVPDAPWSTHAAVQRNATIAGLSRLICVIEPNKTGGSIRTGQSALGLGRRVLVEGGRQDGAAPQLLKDGAARLTDGAGRFSERRLHRAWAGAGKTVVGQPELF